MVARTHKHFTYFWEPGKRVRDGPARTAYVELLPTRNSDDAAAFLRRAVAWFVAQGIIVQAVLTDNGGCYLASPWRAACEALSLRHQRTRPYRPQTSGKVERLTPDLDPQLGRRPALPL